MAFTISDGHRIHWRLDGLGGRPVLVLLTSIGTDLGLYDAAAPSLLSAFQLLRIDTRGHGASDAPAGDYRLGQLAGDVLAVMDAARIPTAFFCGISLGGMIAMELALLAPGRVAALILACTSATMDRAIWTARVTTVRAGGMAAIAEPALDRFFSPAFRARHPAEVHTVLTGLLGMSVDGYAGCVAAIRDMDLAGRLNGVAVPTLVIGGAKDVSTPFETHGQAIQDAIPGAMSAMLRTAHLPCVEDPLAFADTVRRFLAQQAGGTELNQANDVLFEAGLRTRREVLGDAWVDRSLAARTDFTADYQAMITRYAWNEIWGRPGLDRRTRRLLVVAICASLARWEEFRLHVKAGLEQGGFTQDELKEVLMQTAIYAGVPAANTAFTEAADVMRTLNLTADSG